MKRLSVNSIQAVEEVNMIKDDGYVLHFVNPKGKREGGEVRGGLPEYGGKYFVIV